MKRAVCLLGALVIAVSGCAGLEQRAKAGEAKAACTLAVQDLNACLDARQQWIDQPASPRPPCLDQPVSDAHNSYLEKSSERLGTVKDGIAVAVTQMRFNIGTQEQLASLVGLMSNACSRLDA